MKSSISSEGRQSFAYAKFPASSTNDWHFHFHLKQQGNGKWEMQVQWSRTWQNSSRSSSNIS